MMEDNDRESIIRRQTSPDSSRNDNTTLPNGNTLRSPSPLGRQSGYLEFMSGSVPCPTCRGVGNIPKEQEGELVALIPLKDDRLKPRRTYLYVGLAVLICLLAAGLLLFFLLPRNVTIQSNKPLLLPQNLTINKTEKFVDFIIVNQYNLSNSNYVPVSVKNIQMTVLFDTKIMNTVNINKNEDVPIRSKIQLEVPVSISFDKDNDLSFMVDFCSNPNKWYHRNIMVFQTTVEYSYLGNTEEATLNTYQYVSCGNETITTP
ncbi:hypothetical protein KUTeg_008651 [Tegillarca granosa]|uniref:Transmembrane protein 106B n=1 Tax=Tegillarca granosa TaxID=220873 RepID=A0ABQ9F9S5_TEGGR|nr:hypothetical protein KUTeg_008651 [Tegillarca granosa]